MRCLEVRRDEHPSLSNSQPAGRNGEEPISFRRGEQHWGRPGGSDRELLAELYRNASSVFEYGLGESSHIAAHVGVPRYAGVDNDAAWVGNARDGARRDHFRFGFSDTGPSGLYGRPRNEQLRKIPHNYQSAPLHRELETYDAYLVDGRYRVACACASFLHAWSRGGDMGSVRVAVHDWDRGKVGNVTDWAWGYWALKEIANVDRASKMLAVLKIKPSTTEEDRGITCGIGGDSTRDGSKEHSSTKFRRSHSL